MITWMQLFRISLLSLSILAMVAMTFLDACIHETHGGGWFKLSYVIGI